MTAEQASYNKVLTAMGFFVVAIFCIGGAFPNSVPVPDSHTADSEPFHDADERRRPVPVEERRLVAVEETNRNFS